MLSCLMYVRSGRDCYIWWQSRVVYDMSNMKMCKRLITSWKSRIAFTQNRAHLNPRALDKSALTTQRCCQLWGTFTQYWSERTGLNRWTVRLKKYEHQAGRFCRGASTALPVHASRTGLSFKFFQVFATFFHTPQLFFHQNHFLSPPSFYERVFQNPTSPDSSLDN